MTQKIRSEKKDILLEILEGIESGVKNYHQSSYFSLPFGAFSRCFVRWLAIYRYLSEGNPFPDDWNDAGASPTLEMAFNGGILNYVSDYLGLHIDWVINNLSDSNLSLEEIRQNILSLEISETAQEKVDRLKQELQIALEELEQEQLIEKFKDIEINEVFRKLVEHLNRDTLSRETLTAIGSLGLVDEPQFNVLINALSANTKIKLPIL